MCSRKEGREREKGKKGKMKKRKGRRKGGRGEGRKEEGGKGGRGKGGRKGEREGGEKKYSNGRERTHHTQCPEVGGCADPCRWLVSAWSSWLGANIAEACLRPVWEAALGRARRQAVG